MLIIRIYQHVNFFNISHNVCKRLFNSFKVKRINFIFDCITTFSIRTKAILTRASDCNINNNVRMAERSKAPDSRYTLLADSKSVREFWSSYEGVGSNPTSDKITFFNFPYFIRFKIHYKRYITYLRMLTQKIVLSEVGFEPTPS